MKEWISLLGHINPVRVGKLLVVLLVLAFTNVHAQKVVTINVVENNIVVSKPATLAQVVSKLTKTAYTYEYQGKMQPVYTTGKTYYAIIETSTGVIKKRLALQL